MGKQSPRTDEQLRRTASADALRQSFKNLTQISGTKTLNDGSRRGASPVSGAQQQHRLGLRQQHGAGLGQPTLKRQSSMMNGVGGAPYNYEAQVSPAHSKTRNIALVVGVTFFSVLSIIYMYLALQQIFAGPNTPAPWTSPTSWNLGVTYQSGRAPFIALVIALLSGHVLTTYGQIKQKWSFFFSGSVVLAAFTIIGIAAFVLIGSEIVLFNVTVGIELIHLVVLGAIWYKTGPPAHESFHRSAGVATLSNEYSGSPATLNGSLSNLSPNRSEGVGTSPRSNMPHEKGSSLRLALGSRTAIF